MNFPTYIRAALFIASACMSTTLLAQTLVKDDNGFVTGINALEVDGATYNVRFEQGSDGAYDSVFGSRTPTFLNNSSGARTAVDAIAGILNNTTPPSSLDGLDNVYTEIWVPFELKELEDSCYAPDNSLDVVSWTYRQNVADPAAEWVQGSPTCARRTSITTRVYHVTFATPASVPTSVPAMPTYLLAVLAGVLALAGAIRSRVASRY